MAKPDYVDYIGIAIVAPFILLKWLCVILVSPLAAIGWFIHVMTGYEIHDTPNRGDF